MLASKGGIFHWLEVMIDSELSSKKRERERHVEKKKLIHEIFSTSTTAMTLLCEEFFSKLQITTVKQVQHSDTDGGDWTISYIYRG